ncbi:hypothetical protein AX16_006630 [Volvariella volvacea WC 439]|nr:hypothetical protein AX16_006630 [Volvariella volvacea WC 439]
MSNPINLFCLIYGEPFAKAFSVKINRDDTVDGLKELIVNKRSNYFQGIDSVHLELWKVEIPVIAKDKAPQKPELDDEDTLSPTDEIGEVFPKQPLKKHVHIIIRGPSPANVVGERSAIFILNVAIELIN